MATIDIGKDSRGQWHIDCSTHGGVATRSAISDVQADADRHALRHQREGTDYTIVWHDEGNTLVVEASAIGLAPGEWPAALLIAAGPTKMVDGEIVYRDYVGAGITIRVLND